MTTLTTENSDFNNMGGIHFLDASLIFCPFSASEHLEKAVENELHSQDIPNCTPQGTQKKDQEYPKQPVPSPHPEPGGILAQAVEIPDQRLPKTSLS